MVNTNPFLLNLEILAKGQRKRVRVIKRERERTGGEREKWAKELRTVRSAHTNCISLLRSLLYCVFMADRITQKEREREKELHGRGCPTRNFCVLSLKLAFHGY